MKERPILMSAPMVLAILEGRKTQTRRECKGVGGWMHHHACLTGDCAHQKQSDCDAELLKASPYGIAGDRLWVRERFHLCFYTDGRCAGNSYVVFPDGSQKYKDGAYYPGLDEYAPGAFDNFKWKPSIFMPRWASRITLEIVSVRVERLQDISEEDSKAEGVPVGQRAALDPDSKTCLVCGKPRAFHAGAARPCPQGMGTVFSNSSFKGGYKLLWESINGKGSWDKNPWVWVIEFKKV